MNTGLKELMLRCEKLNKNLINDCKTYERQDDERTDSIYMDLQAIIGQTQELTEIVLLALSTFDGMMRSDESEWANI